MFTNISELGVAAQKNDAKAMISLVRPEGCHVNYNGTLLSYSEDNPLVPGQTPLHIAAPKGNKGKFLHHSFLIRILIKFLIVAEAVSVLLSIPETDLNPQGVIARLYSTKAPKNRFFPRMEWKPPILMP